MVWEFRRRFCKSCLADSYVALIIGPKPGSNLSLAGSSTTSEPGTSSVRRGYMRLSSRFESMGLGSFYQESTQKVTSFTQTHQQTVYPTFVSVAHGGRNVYYLKEDVERFADEASTIRNSGRDLLDLANRCESLREVRSSVSGLSSLHHCTLSFSSMQTVWSYGNASRLKTRKKN